MCPDKVTDKPVSIFVTEWLYQVPTSYIDPIELAEALDLYFAGLLNSVSTEMVNYPLRQLIPGKALISQLDQDTMTLALSRLDTGDHAAIQNHHTIENYGEYQNDYVNAFLNLSDIVLTLIN